MLKGYDDGGFRVRLCHMPLDALLRCRGRDLCSPAKHLNWGKHVTDSGAIRHPYTTRSQNGWDPFRNTYRK